MARIVGAAGAELIADIAGTQLTTMPAERVFLLRLDRVEAAALIGHPITTYADASAANSLLLERGACDHAITTVGALGAVCSDRDAHLVIAAPALPTPLPSDAAPVTASSQRSSTGWSSART